jgi:lysophospholipase L1-like esterase
MGRRGALLAVVGLVTAVLAGIAPASTASAAPAYPSSMAALGDSITRAYDVCCSYADHPAQSWSTGSASDTITSHYERLLSRNPAISGHAANLAKTGAKMAAGKDQAAIVMSDVGYVTVLLGANDVCTSSIATMTSVSDFESQFWNTLFNVHFVAPKALVFVSSIPNIYQLWSTLHTNYAARLVWASAKICPSMLSSSNTEDQRKQVAAREAAFNDAMQRVCTSATYSAICRWDNLATFNVNFSSSQVSTLDYFHPSQSGQAVLASTTWKASYWGG